MSFNISNHLSEVLTKEILDIELLENNDILNRDAMYFDEVIAILKNARDQVHTSQEYFNKRVANTRSKLKNPQDF